MARNQVTTSKGGYPEAVLFMPHPNFADEVNQNICQSTVEGGVFLDELPLGAKLEVETKNRLYLLESRGQGRPLISGHTVMQPEFTAYGNLPHLRVASNTAPRMRI